MAKYSHFTKKAIFSLAQIVDQNAPRSNDCEIIAKMLQTLKDNIKKKSQTSRTFLKFKSIIKERRLASLVENNLY